MMNQTIYGTGGLMDRCEATPRLFVEELLYGRLMGTSDAPSACRL